MAEIRAIWCRGACFFLSRCNVEIEVGCCVLCVRCEVAAPYTGGKHCVTFTKYSHLSRKSGGGSFRRCLQQHCRDNNTCTCSTNSLIKQGSQRGSMNCRGSLGWRNLANTSHTSNLLLSPATKLFRVEIAKRRGERKKSLLGFNTSGLKVGHKLC